MDLNHTPEQAPPRAEARASVEAHRLEASLAPIERVTVNQEISRAKVPGILDVIAIGMLGSA